MPLPRPLLRAKLNVNKYDFGHVLVVAGSAPMLGAAVLTASAAMRSGAGLVTCAVARELNLTLQCKLPPEIMTFPYRYVSDISKVLDKFDAVALGPGMGRGAASSRMIIKILRVFKGPMVIDADALNVIAKNLTVLKSNRSSVVLTPHPGEMSRLLGVASAYIEKNRKKVASDFSRKYHCVLVLKGHRTVVAGNGKSHINNSGNAGMAKAGSGDVLTGMIAAFLAQGIEPFKAAKLGVYLHGRAGDKAADVFSKAGMTASDIIMQIPVIIRNKQ